MNEDGLLAQVLLSICFIAIAMCSWFRLGQVKIIASGMSLLCVAALYFIWSPEILSAVARFVGIGRGADLVFYAFLIFVLFELLIVRIRDHQRMELITQLARHIALNSVRHPPSAKEVKRTTPCGDENEVVKQ